MYYFMKQQLWTAEADAIIPHHPACSTKVQRGTRIAYSGLWIICMGNQSSTRQMWKESWAELMSARIAQLDLARLLLPTFRTSVWYFVCVCPRRHCACSVEGSIHDTSPESQLTSTDRIRPAANITDPMLSKCWNHSLVCGYWTGSEHCLDNYT